MLRTARTATCMFFITSILMISLISGCGGGGAIGGGVDESPANGSSSSVMGGSLKTEKILPSAI